MQLCKYIFDNFTNEKTIMTRALRHANVDNHDAFYSDMDQYYYFPHSTAKTQRRHRHYAQQQQPQPQHSQQQGHTRTANSKWHPKRRRHQPARPIIDKIEWYSSHQLKIELLNSKECWLHSENIECFAHISIASKKFELNSKIKIECEKFGSSCESPQGYLLLSNLSIRSWNNFIFDDKSDIIVSVLCRNMYPQPFVDSEWSECSKPLPIPTHIISIYRNNNNYDNIENNNNNNNNHNNNNNSNVDNNINENKKDDDIDSYNSTNSVTDSRAINNNNDNNNNNNDDNNSNDNNKEMIENKKDDENICIFDMNESEELLDEIEFSIIASEKNDTLPQLHHFDNKKFQNENKMGFIQLYRMLRNCHSKLHCLNQVQTQLVEQQTKLHKQKMNCTIDKLKQEMISMIGHKFDCLKNDCDSRIKQLTDQQKNIQTILSNKQNNWKNWNCDEICEWFAYILMKHNINNEINTLKSVAWQDMMREMKRLEWYGKYLTICDDSELQKKFGIENNDFRCILLKEIKNLVNDDNDSDENDENENYAACCYCENPVNIAYFPCGHVCVCATCNDDPEKYREECLYCWQKIESRKQVYIT